jgi:hypothetical protein
MENTFSASDIAWATKKGNAQVEGSAFLRQRGGGLVTCAGQDVHFTPKSKYSTERHVALYGNDNFGIMKRGLARAIAGTAIEGETPEGYLNSSIVTQCDVDGKFYLEDIVAGEYYVTTVVEWTLDPYGINNEGGYIMKRVVVKDNQINKVVITKNYQ